MKQWLFALLFCLNVPPLLAQEGEPQAEKTVPPPQAEVSQSVTPPHQGAIPADAFKRDPFRLPQYLIDKLSAKPLAEAANTIDDTVEPIRRWAVTDYTLVGIIWDVKNPKALIRDKQNGVHVIKINDRVGNKEGRVKSVREGSVIVLENDTPKVIRLKK
ncbi:MAG: hypothetical protein A2622_08040 [Bdellovibrionales bacterium RIFCSPHIGHO2_01_FULL_40_29]|nr:MAG: hypothetical protein A2622_08040 [Bdellovibrionales bacterium RIFCSPHIGHO2_01_FULL_40_29]OFZ35446.1 MAG: hypothetical protein A3D17_07275 [Bdellovibrionales bacterium RIFCSPHIGHO2_02_FULL_40_15]